MADFPPPKYVDDVECIEKYAETVQAFFDTAGAVRIELCVYRWTTEFPIRPATTVPVSRAVMPLGLAVVLRDQMGGLVMGIGVIGLIYVRGRR